MLMLSRKVDQAIIIAGEIRIVVAQVRGVAVRLGVQAPPDVTVDREEIHVNKSAQASRGPPEVFTQQEYDRLADPQDCLPALFCGRQMYVRQRPVVMVG